MESESSAPAGPGGKQEEGLGPAPATGRAGKKRAREQYNACESCHVSKVKCDKSRPCGRCCKLRKECVPHVAKRRGRRRLTGRRTPKKHTELLSVSPSAYTPSVADVEQLGIIKSTVHVFQPILESMLRNRRSRSALTKFVEGQMRLMYHQGNRLCCVFVHNWTKRMGLRIRPAEVVGKVFNIEAGMSALTLAPVPTPDEPVLSNSLLHAMLFTLFDQDGLKLHCNSKFTELTGYCSADLTDSVKRGLDVVQLLIHRDDLMEFGWCKSKQCMPGYSQCEHVLKLVKKDGTPELCYFLGRSTLSFSPIRFAQSWQVIALPQSQHIPAVAAIAGTPATVGAQGPVQAGGVSDFGSSLLEVAAEARTHEGNHRSTPSTEDDGDGERDMDDDVDGHGYGYDGCGEGEVFPWELEGVAAGHLTSADFDDFMGSGEAVGGAQGTPAAHAPATSTTPQQVPREGGDKLVPALPEVDALLQEQALDDFLNEVISEQAP